MTIKNIGLCTILAIPLTVFSAPQQITKEQLEKAFEDAINGSKEDQKLYNKIVNQEEAQLKKQGVKELDHDKINQKAHDVISAQIEKNNMKKYGLPKNIAKMTDIPFSIPLIREMFIAANAHNKQKLQMLLSEYFTIMFGKDWKYLLTQYEDVEGYGKVRELLRHLRPGLMNGLSNLYFGSTVTYPVFTFKPMERLVAELFDKAK